MKKLEELSYYVWLEDVIRERNGTDFSEKLSEEEKDANIMLLVQYIEKKYPKMYEKLLGGIIDASNNSVMNRNDILGFLGKTEKGTCVTWKDMNGNEFLFINAGQGKGLDKRRIIIMSGDESKKGEDFIKKAVISEILRKDIQHVYEKILSKEQKKKQNKTYLSEMFSKRNSITHTASSFEKNFKKMIKKQGFGASSLNTCEVMVRTMSGSEKKKLFNTFTALGVKTGDDLEMLLNRWKTEALHEKPAVKKLITRSLSNEMGIGL